MLVKNITKLKTCIFKNNLTLITEIREIDESSKINFNFYIKNSVRDESYKQSGFTHLLKNILDYEFLVNTRNSQVDVFTFFNRETLNIHFSLFKWDKHVYQTFNNVFNLIRGDVRRELFNNGCAYHNRIHEEKEKLEKNLKYYQRLELDSNDFLPFNCFGNKEKSLGMPYIGNSILNENYYDDFISYLDYPLENMIISINGLKDHKEGEDLILSTL